MNGKESMSTRSFSPRYLMLLFPPALIWASYGNFTGFAARGDAKTAFLFGYIVYWVVCIGVTQSRAPIEHNQLGQALFEDLAQHDPVAVAGSRDPFRARWPGAEQSRTVDSGLSL